MPDFFVVSVSGLTTNPTNGQIAQIGTQLYASAHHFSEIAPTSITWQWRNNAGDIEGATDAAYMPSVGNNLENIYPVATPFGLSASQEGPAHTVRFAVPMVIGVLPNVSYFKDTGEKTVDSTIGFTGEGLTYFVNTDFPGVVIDGATGILTIPTGTQASGEITVTARNSGGSVQNTFTVSVASVASIPAKMSAPTVTVTGSTSLRVDLASVPDDGGSPIISYDMRLKKGDDVWMAIKGISDPEVLSGLVADTEHRVRTRAVNAIGRGPWSANAVVKTTTENNEIPTISTNAENTVDVTVSDGTFTLTVSGAVHAHHNGTHGPFNTVDLNSGPVLAVPPFISGAAGVGDTLIRSPGLWIHESDDAPVIGTEWYSGATGTGDTDASYTTIDGDRGKTITCVEVATNTAGARNGSSSGIAIPIGPSTPAQMVGPEVTSTGTTSISVDRGVTPADGGSPITSYDLRWQPNGGSWAIVTGINDPQLVTGLTTGILYNAQTRAVNAIGTGAWSTSGSATTNTTSGALFSDDFTGYPLNFDLKDSTNYTNVDGFLSIKAQDDNGTRVARQPVGTQAEILTYTDQVVAARRKVSWKLHTLQSGFPGTTRFYASYADRDNYILAQIDSNGWVQIQQMRDGSLDFTHDIAPGALLEGKTINIIVDTNSVDFQVEGVNIYAQKTGLTMPTMGPPGFRLQNNTSATAAPAISDFIVEEL